jgi:GH24 family phage-related lysozyme (muramidase)
MIDFRDSKLIEILKEEEGFRHAPYQDHLGNWTIGYGTLIEGGLDLAQTLTLFETKGRAFGQTGISKDQAHALLLLHVRETMLSLKACHFWTKLNDDQQRALVLMGYQLGWTGLRKFENMFAALESGQFSKVPLHMKDSNWAQLQTPGRAARVISLFRG